MSQTISAVFIDPDDAERAIGALEDHGIRQDSISVVATHKEADTNLPPAAEEPGSDGFLEVQTEDPPTPTDMNSATESRLGAASTSVVEAEGKHGITTTTAADARRGAAEGSVVGLGIGLLAGAAALFVPGVGPVLAAGPLWAALSAALGTTAAGAVAGGVTGYLVDQGVSEATAAHFGHAVGSGSVMVSVTTESDQNAADIEAILTKYAGNTVTAH